MILQKYSYIFCLIVFSFKTGFAELNNYEGKLRIIKINPKLSIPITDMLGFGLTTEFGFSEKKMDYSLVVTLVDARKSINDYGVGGRTIIEKRSIIVGGGVSALYLSNLLSKAKLLYGGSLGYWRGSYSYYEELQTGGYGTNIYYLHDIHKHYMYFFSPEIKILNKNRHVQSEIGVKSYLGTAMMSTLNFGLNFIW